MSSESFNIIDILFIILYNTIIIIGFLLEFKEKFTQNERIEKKVRDKITTDIIVDIDKDEKIMLKVLSKTNGFDSIEEFMCYVLNEKLDG